MPTSTPVKRKAPPTKTATRKRSSYMGVTGQSKKTPAEAMASASVAEFSFEGAVTLLVGHQRAKDARIPLSPHPRLTVLRCGNEERMGGRADTHD